MATTNQLQIGALFLLLGGIGVVIATNYAPVREDLARKVTTFRERVVPAIKPDLVKKVSTPLEEQKQIPKDTEYSYMKMYHGGSIGLVGVHGHKARDFDGDGINDKYHICKDGALVAYSSKKGYWADFGKE